MISAPTSFASWKQRRPSSSGFKLSSARRSDGGGSSSHRSPVTLASHSRGGPGRFSERKPEQQHEAAPPEAKTPAPKQSSHASSKVMVNATWLNREHYAAAQESFYKYEPDAWLPTIQLRLTPFIYYPWMCLNLYVIVLCFWCEVVQPSLKPLFSMPMDAHVVMGGALSFLVVFRTNSSYDRWWEARCAWQTVVSSCRCLAVTTGPALRDEASQERLFMQLVTFAVSFKAYLRDVPIAREEVASRMDWAQVSLLNQSSCAPLVAIRMLASTVRRSLPTHDDEHGLGPNIYAEATEQLRVLTMNVGACERIKCTPMTYGYIATLRSFLALWLATLPTSLIGEYGWVSVPALSVIGFLFLTVEQVQHLPLISH